MGLSFASLTLGLARAGNSGSVSRVLVSCRAQLSCLKVQCWQHVQLWSKLRSRNGWGSQAVWMEHLESLSGTGRRLQGEGLRRHLVAGPVEDPWWWLPPLFASGVFPALQLPVP